MALIYENAMQDAIGFVCTIFPFLFVGWIVLVRLDTTLWAKMGLGPILKAAFFLGWGVALLIGCFVFGLRVLL